jgi:hypothetical protein
MHFQIRIGIQKEIQIRIGIKTIPRTKIFIKLFGAYYSGVNGNEMLPYKQCEQGKTR